MKLNKKLILLSAAAWGLAATGVMPVEPVGASSVKTEAVNPEAVIGNAKLTKLGYIVRVVNDKDADPIYVGKSNYKYALTHFGAFKGKTISPAKVQNVKFRIEKVVTFHGKMAGAPLYLAVSKDKKYSCWTSQAMLQYYYLNSKQMSGVVKPLKRIINRSSTSLKLKKNKSDFNAAWKAAKKLKGSQKTFVVNSLKQIKKEGNLDNGGNLLTFGMQKLVRQKNSRLKKPVIFMVKVILQICKSKKYKVLKLLFLFHKISEGE